MTSLHSHFPPRPANNTNIAVEGALLYKLRMPLNYWEAKDADDDIDAEVSGEFRKDCHRHLQPSSHHIPLTRYVTPEQFAVFEAAAAEMGFKHAACGPMVRSSYHADQQAQGVTT